MLGQAATGLARIPLFQGLMDGTILQQVVTHRIHLLIRWILQRVYTMRQPLLSVYIKMSYKRVRWRITSRPWSPLRGVSVTSSNPLLLYTPAMISSHFLGGIV